MAAKGHIDGMVAPRIFVYDKKGKLILNRFGREIGREATKFEYVYSEEDDDRCTITFQTSDVYLNDLDALKRDKLLIVKWGFVNTDGELITGPTRLIAIRDRASEYGKDRITLTLKCSDNISYLKKRKVDGTREGNFIDFLNEIIEGKYSATLIVSGSELVTYNDTEASSYNTTTNGQMTMAVDHTAAPDFAWFETTRIIKGNSKSVVQAIEDELMFADGGPYFVDGRDNTITIRNRDFNQKNKHTYYYNSERGDVISFKPKTNIEKSEITQNRIANLEPGSRGVFSEIKEFIRVSDLTKDYDPIASSQEVDAAALEEYLANIKKKYELAISSGNVFHITEDEYNDGFKIIPDFEQHILKLHHVNDRKPSEDVTHIAEDGTVTNTLLYSEAVDHTAAPFEYFEEFDYSIPAEQILSSAVAQDGIEALMQNEALHREHKKYVADIVIIGDPDLKSSQLIKIAGVAKIHAGSYYTTKVKHTLSFSSGYITSIETIRKPSEVKVGNNSYRSKLSTSSNKYISSKKVLSDEQREFIYSEYAKRGKNGLLQPADDGVLYTQAVSDGTISKGLWDDNADGIPERPASEDVPVGSGGSGKKYTIDELLSPPNNEKF